MLNKISKIFDPIYLTGGCVRDKILGRTPKDFDFATPLSPEEIENLQNKVIADLNKKGYSLR